MSKFNRGRPMMHQARCSKCGRDCEVPFRPTGSRPVFCNECFDKQGDRNTGKKRMFEAVCGKCGNKCEVPFQPNPDKPVYCNACFGKGDRGGNKSPDQFKQQFEILNAKLDRILKALAPAVSSEAVPVEKKSKKKASKTKPTAKKAKK